MAVITLCSATGAPGTTTTALGLTLAWPGDALLVDADREPAQAVQAGFLRGVDLGGRGLAALAQAHREQRSLLEEVWLQTARLEGGGERERRLLPGFANPAAAGLFLPIWGPLMEALAAVGDTGCDVLLDAGRIGREGLAREVVAGSDLLLVCSRTSLRALAALRLHLPTVRGQVEAQGVGTELGLLLVGAGRPYGRREIEAQFDCPVALEVAWDPRHAELLSDGSGPARSLGRSALSRSHRLGAAQLAQRLRRRDELVRVPPVAEGVGA